MYVFLKTNFRTNPHDVRFTAEMSALGQKQTCAVALAMSALSPMEDIEAARSRLNVISAAFNVEFHFDAFGPRVGN